MKILGDVEAVIELENGIRRCILQINQALKNIHIALIATGATWEDEGYRQMNRILMDVMDSVTRHVDDIGDLLAALKEYEKILGGTGNQGSGGQGAVGVSAMDQAAREGDAVPHNFAQTRETWKQTEDGTIYDSPVEKRSQLNLNQGKVPRFKGTCGLCSCENVLRLAGVEVTEADVVKYASENKLCVYRRFGMAGTNGGTSAGDRQEILRHFGLESTQMPSSIENIALAVSEGRGVIVSVHASRLWYSVPFVGDFHAVTVTSVKKDAVGNILGFYIADSGIHGKDGDGYYSREKFEKALTKRPLNVTSQIIR